MLSAWTIIQVLPCQFTFYKLMFNLPNLTIWLRGLTWPGISLHRVAQLHIYSVLFEEEDAEAVGRWAWESRSFFWWEPAMFIQGRCKGMVACATRGIGRDSMGVNSEKESVGLSELRGIRKVKAISSWAGYDLRVTKHDADIHDPHQLNSSHEEDTITKDHLLSWLKAESSSGSDGTRDGTSTIEEKLTKSHFLASFLPVVCTFIPHTTDYPSLLQTKDKDSYAGLKTHLCLPIPKMQASPGWADQL